MIVKLCVAAYGCDGPDLFFCKVECSQEQYDNGDHYDRAKKAAEELGYESPMVALDENDNKPIFDAYRATVALARTHKI